MKLIFYLMIIKLINHNFITAILSIIFILFLFKTLFNKPKQPNILTNKRSINLNILIPIFNEEKNLEELINQIYKDNKKKFNVTMINDLSTDDSLNILKKYKDIYKYDIINRENKRGYVAGVLNDGLNSIINNDNVNYIGVINADCILEKNLIDNVIDYLENYDITALNISNQAKYNKNIWQYFANLEKSFKNNLFYNVEASLNNGYFIEKKILKKINGWSETELTEDLDLSLKLKKNKQIIYQSKLYVYDDVPDNIISLFNQKYRWLKGDITNRTKKIPNDLFEIIVNIYYIFPLYTLFCIFTLNLRINIILLQILILVIEGILFYWFDDEKNFKNAIIYPISQFIYSIYFYLNYMIDTKNKW
jgi:cellulose synthase/poly-beta-1,6-N-acetylglucosamine synthase-like glycosyltransferase